MRYSIILPVYNAQSTLRRCLDSIVVVKSAQTPDIVR